MISYNSNHWLVMALSVRNLLAEGNSEEIQAKIQPLVQCIYLELHGRLDCGVICFEIRVPFLHSLCESTNALNKIELGL